MVPQVRCDGWVARSFEGWIPATHLSFFPQLAKCFSLLGGFLNLTTYCLPRTLDPSNFIGPRFLLPCKSLKILGEALEILGGWWAPQTLQPTSVPINILRPEARGWKLIKYSLHTELDNWGSWFILWALTNTQKPFPP